MQDLCVVVIELKKLIKRVNISGISIRSSIDDFIINYPPLPVPLRRQNTCLILPTYIYEWENIKPTTVDDLISSLCRISNYDDDDKFNNELNKLVNFFNDKIYD